jgi:class 3 adenylate cyclase
MTDGSEIRNIQNILSAADSINRLREELRRTTAGLGILFVDLVGSTELKHKVSQEEWLPVVARFLFTVSGVITEHGGAVVKYIGDEVMGVFAQTEVGISSVKMEACLWNIEEKLQHLSPRSFAKYSLDYGEAAEIHFEGFPRDYLGSAVDRCARIARLAKKGTAVASEAYVQQSKNPKSWRRISSTVLRGFPDKEVIYQLHGLGDEISSEEILLAVSNPADLMYQVRDLNDRLNRCMEELKVQRRRS